MISFLKMWFLFYFPVSPPLPYQPSLSLIPTHTILYLLLISFHFASRRRYLEMREEKREKKRKYKKLSNFPPIIKSSQCWGREKNISPSILARGRPSGTSAIPFKLHPLVNSCVKMAMVKSTYFYSFYLMRLPLFHALFQPSASFL